MDNKLYASNLSGKLDHLPSWAMLNWAICTLPLREVTYFGSVLGACALKGLRSAHGLSHGILLAHELLARGFTWRRDFSHGFSFGAPDFWHAFRSLNRLLTRIFWRMYYLTHFFSRLLHKIMSEKACGNNRTGAAESESLPSTIRYTLCCTYRARLPNQYYANGSGTHQFSVFSFWVHQSWRNFVVKFRASLKKFSQEERALNKSQCRVSVAQRKSLSQRKTQCQIPSAKRKSDRNPVRKKSRFRTPCAERKSVWNLRARRKLSCHMYVRRAKSATKTPCAEKKSAIRAPNTYPYFNVWSYIKVLTRKSDPQTIWPKTCGDYNTLRNKLYLSHLY